MGRNIDITDGGKLRFFENQEELSPPPQDKISLAAPDAVTSYGLTLPATLTNNSYLKVGVGGQLLWTTTSIGFNWINIIDEGATRGANSSTAITAAITAAIATNGDCVVYIPEGTFWLDTTISSPFATGVTVKFIGANPEKSILLLKGGATDEGIDASANLLKRIEFHNIQFNCNAMGTGTPSYERGGAMLTLKAEEIVIEDCIFKNIGISPALQINEADTFARVNNCLFTDIYTTAGSDGGNYSGFCISIVNSGAISAQAARPSVSITNNQFLCANSAADIGAGAKAIFANIDQSDPRTITVANNYFYQCGSNFGLEASIVGAVHLKYAPDATIRNNIFAYATGPSMVVENSTRVRFVDNKVLGESTGWRTTHDPAIASSTNLAVDAEGLIFRGNVFETVDSVSTQLSAKWALKVVGDSDTFTKDITIRGNRFHKMERGISLDYVYGDIRIQDNEFAQLRSTSVGDAEDSCIFIGNLNGSVAADQANVRVEGNSSDDCFGRFLSFEAADTDNTINFTILNNRWETETAGSVYARVGVLTLDGTSGGSDRINNVTLAGNRWSGLPSVAALFTYVYLIGVAGKMKVESVYDFGAVGDGVTDDTKPIITAFVALDGHTINIPAGGVFSCPQIINTTPDFLTIKESDTVVTGGGRILPGGTDGATAYAGPMLTVGDGTVDVKVQNIRIENIELRPAVDGYGTAIKIIGNTEYVSIKNCKLGTEQSSAVRWATGVEHTALGSFTQVSECDISSDTIGVSFTAGNNHSVANNRLSGGGTGVSIVGTSTTVLSENNNINGNTIANTETGIALSKANYTAISGNNIVCNSATSKGISYTATASTVNVGVNITGNTVRAANTGISLVGEDVSGWLSLITITGNSIRGRDAADQTSLAGVYLKDCAAATISGNSLYGSGTLGGVTSAAIFVDDTRNCVITSNQISGHQYAGGVLYGIIVKETAATMANNAIITNNTVDLGTSLTAYYAIRLDGALFATVVNNNIGQTQNALEKANSPTLQNLTMVEWTDGPGVEAFAADYLRVTKGGMNAATGLDSDSVYYIPIHQGT